MKNKLGLFWGVLSFSFLHGTIPHNTFDRLVSLTNQTTFDDVRYLCNDMHKNTNAPDRSGRIKRPRALNACAQGLKWLNVSDTGRYTTTPIYFDLETSKWIYSNGNELKGGCSSLIELTWIENANVFAAIKNQEFDMRYAPEQCEQTEHDSCSTSTGDCSGTISQQLIKKLEPHQFFLIEFVDLNDFLGLCFDDGNEEVFKTVHKRALERYFLHLFGVDEESEAYDREYRHVCNLASIFAGYFGEIVEDTLGCINEHLIALENEQWVIADMLVASHLLPEDKIALFYSIDDSLYADIEWLYNEFIVNHNVDSLVFSQLLQLLISNPDMLELFLHTVKECSETYKNVYLLVVKNPIIFSHVMHTVCSISDMYDCCTVLTQQCEKMVVFLETVALCLHNDEAAVQYFIEMLCTYPHLILLFFDSSTFAFHDADTLAAMIDYCFTVEHSTLTLNHGIRMALTNGWNNVITALCEHNEAIIRIFTNESIQKILDMAFTLAGLKTGICELDETMKKALLQGHIVPTFLEWVLRGNTVDAIQERYAALCSFAQGYNEDEPLYRFAHYAIRDAQLLDLIMTNGDRALDLVAIVDTFVDSAKQILRNNNQQNERSDTTSVSNFVKDHVTSWLTDHYSNLLAQEWFSSLKPKLAIVIKNRIRDELLTLVTPTPAHYVTEPDTQVVPWQSFANSGGSIVPVSNVMDPESLQIVAYTVAKNPSLWQRVSSFLKKIALPVGAGIGIWLYLKNTSSDNYEVIMPGGTFIKE